MGLVSDWLRVKGRRDIVVTRLVHTRVTPQPLSRIGGKLPSRQRQRQRRPRVKEQVAIRTNDAAGGAPAISQRLRCICGSQKLRRTCNSQKLRCTCNAQRLRRTCNSLRPRCTCDFQRLRRTCDFQRLRCPISQPRADDEQSRRVPREWYAFFLAGSETFFEFTGAPYPKIVGILFLC